MMALELRPMQDGIALILTACLLLGFVRNLCSLFLRNGPQTNEQATFTIQKPLVLRGRISHRRLFPKRHQLLYPFLMVGIPIRRCPSNWLLSVDASTRWRRGWLQVNAQDHLGRHNTQLRISEKLDDFLLSQGEDPASYPTAYLVTSPRVWNYKFCPASFWFLYSNEYQLRAMIVEVNNTFGERRLYFLPATDNSREPGDDSSRFRYTWSKDFHVSPFNSRKGKYSLSARDPSQASTSENEVIHITATLLSSKSRPKMVTRLWTDKKPIDPFSITTYQAMRLLFPWCLVGLFTYPRIVFEAILLAHRRKLHIWYRPEPRTGTIPRRATSSESYISLILSAYIQQILLSAPDAFHIHLQSPTHSHNNYVEFSTPTAGETPLSPTIVLTVLTPRFYTILLGHRSLASLLMSACLDPVIENRTAQACLVTPFSMSIDESRSKKELIGFISRAERSYENKFFRGRNSPNAFLIPTLQYLLDWVLATVRPLRGTLGALYPYPGLPRLRSEDIRSMTLPREPEGRGEDATRGRELERYFLDDFVKSHYRASQWVWYVAAVVRALIWERVVRFVGGA